MVVSLSFGVVCNWFCFFFFKQKTAYEMRISDWSSDVCSSDLRLVRHRRNIGPARRAASHHAGDLRNALGRHLRLIVENPPEMVAVGKDLRLVRQVRAA